MRLVPDSPVSPPRRRLRLRLLSIAFLTAVAWSAVRPVDVSDYLLEIATPLAGFVVLVATRRRFEFTPLAYGLMFCEGLVLVVGAHYTHERVPAFDWLRDALHLSRNHYDRFAHACVGFFLAIPAREILSRATPLRGRALAILSVTSLLALAAVYEISEWWIAEIASPTTAQAYLGSQGDPWDAQKDMLLDGLGAIAALLTLSRVHDVQLASRVRRASP